MKEVVKQVDSGGEECSGRKAGGFAARQGPANHMRSMPPARRGSPAGTRAATQRRDADLEMVALAGRRRGEPGEERRGEELAQGWLRWGERRKGEGSL